MLREQEQGGKREKGRVRGRERTKETERGREFICVSKISYKMGTKHSH